MSAGGKGSAAHPFSVPVEEFKANLERVFAPEVGDAVEVNRVTLVKVRSPFGIQRRATLDEAGCSCPTCHALIAAADETIYQGQKCECGSLLYEVS